MVVAHWACDKSIILQKINTYSQGTYGTTILLFAHLTQPQWQWYKELLGIAIFFVSHAIWLPCILINGLPCTQIWNRTVHLPRLIIKRSVLVWFNPANCVCVRLRGPITVWLPCYVQFLRRQDPLSRQRRLTFIAPITLNPVPVPDRGVVT